MFERSILPNLIPGVSTQMNVRPLTTTVTKVKVAMASANVAIEGCRTGKFGKTFCIAIHRINPCSK